MIEDLVPRVREALKVSSGYDADTIPEGIKRSCKFLLREYDFPKTERRFDSDPFAVDADSMTLPAGFQKPYQAKLMTTEGTKTYFRDLPRGARDAEPNPEHGPQSYSIVGPTLYLDTPLNTAGYWIRLWYKSCLLDETSEAWLTDEFEDAVFVFSTMELSVEFGKPEVLQVYTPLWERRVMQLGTILAESEYSDSEVIMRRPMPRAQDRYPTGNV